MEKFYEISNIKIIYFQKPSLSDIDGYYGIDSVVKQLFYVKDGTLIDIFKDKYIDGIYQNGKMPAFNYNPVNYISTSLFNNKELKSGLISEDRLLEIYCYFNSLHISYDEIIGNNVDNVVDIRKYVKTRRKEDE